jgi:hypothetical protein
VDNKAITPTSTAKTTYLTSMAGTISNIIGNTFTVNVTSTPALSAAYINVYEGMTLRPNINYTNGTGSDWSDDQILTVVSNNATQLVTSGSYVSVNVGDTFRTIHIFDYLDVSGNAVLDTNGDIYVLNSYGSAVGSVSNNGLITANDAAGAIDPFSPVINNANFNNVYWRKNLTSLTIQGSTSLVSSGSLYTQAFSFQGGTVTINSGLTVVSTATIGAGTTISGNSLNFLSDLVQAATSMTTNSINVGGNWTINSGVITHNSTTASVTNRLIAVVGGTFTMNGGSIDVSARGYLGGVSAGAVAYSFSSGGVPSSVLASTGYTAGSHGGYGGNSGGTPGVTYDNYRDPQWPGGGAKDPGTGAGPGGGVVKITAGGMCQINSGATIKADGQNLTYWLNGAGGAINLNCLGFDGTALDNAITANGGNGNSASGGGGMIALTSTGDSSKWSGKFAFPSNSTNLNTFKGVVVARSGTAGLPGAAGTVFAKHSGITYGALIVDNKGLVPASSSKPTYLSSLSGTIIGVSGSTITVNVTSTPALTSAFDNVYQGMTFRPNLSFNNGTAGDWTDDQILTVTSNNSTQLVTAGSIAQVTTGDSFRTIHIFDYLDVSGNANLDTNGDIYVLSSLGANSGSVSNTGLVNPVNAGGSLTLGNVTLSGSLNNNNMPLKSNYGTLTIDGATISGGTISAANLNIISGNVTYDFINLSADLSVSGGSLTVDNLSIGNNMSVSGGTIKHKATDTTTTHRLLVTVGSLFTMTGGLIDANGLGYTAGRSYGDNGIPTNATENASTLNSGGSHGAFGTVSTGSTGMVFDDYANPEWPGGGGGASGVGGGVIKITATGLCTINPTPTSGERIRADGTGGGAGGTVNLRCAGFDGIMTGSAPIHANGSNNGTSYAGGGGRIALVSTGNASQWQNVLSFPGDSVPLTNIKANLGAYGGVASSAVGGAGTIFLKNSSLSFGLLLIDNGDQTGTTAQTRLIVANANANIVDSKIDAYSIKMTAATTPFANKLGLFKARKIDLWPITGGSEDPLHFSHSVVTLTGNTNNELVDSNGGFSPIVIGSNDYKYRVRHHLDYLAISGKANVSIPDGNLVVEKCDIANSASSAFAVPSGSSLNGFNFASSFCSAAGLSGSITFSGGLYLQP